MGHETDLTNVGSGSYAWFIMQLCIETP